MQHIAVDRVTALNYLKHIDINDYAHILPSFIIKKINAAAYGAKVFVRGLPNKRSSQTYFNRLAPDDWFLFFDATNGVCYKAQILTTFTSPDLSDQLWNTNYYENILIFKNIYETSIPYSQFNPTIKYSDDWNCGHGFMVAAEGNPNIPEAIKLIEAAPGTAITELPVIPAPTVTAPLHYADDINPDPMFITSFTVVDKLGLGALVSNLQDKVEHIFFYHINSKFNAAAYLANPDRKKITYDITIENAPSNSEILQRIKPLIDELERIIKKAGLDNDEYGRTFRSILSCLRQGISAGQEFRRFIEELPELSEYGPEIKALIHEIDYQLLLLKALGIFNSSTGIHLYYDRIDASAKREGFNLLDYMSYVAAHEMEHAWHYADVKSKSGKWYLHSIPEYNWVKESIAEYFALCYCQYAGNTSGETAVHNRTPYAFPYDGGYSGALLLEAKPDNFDELYKKSLDDMKTAFKKIN